MATVEDREATVTPYQLCSICKSVLETYAEDWDTLITVNLEFEERKAAGTLTPEEIRGLTSSIRQHHANVEELQNAAAQGCHLCALLARSVMALRSLRAQDKQLWIGCFRETNDATDAGNLVLWDEKPEDCLMPRIGIVYADAVQEPNGADRAGSRLYTSVDNHRWGLNTGSMASFCMVRRWLRQCIDEHQSCGRLFRKKDATPNRLLDLSAFRNSVDLRLVDTAALREERYAALSYSWGDCVTTTLRASNLHVFRSRIPFEDLPRTVQEAVEVCRQLSIRYLWVDALCIVQGSSSDFAHEVARMGSIYANSLVTIAAADSSACNMGLFRTCLPLEVEDLVFVQTNRTLRVSSSENFKCQRHAFYLEDAVLSSRAWTYQERALAPRTIHFDATRIVWECRERAMCRLCESLTYPPADALRVPKGVFEALRPRGGGIVSMSTIQRLWSHTVYLYSKMLLSNEDDRLSALAGIAQLIQDRSAYQASQGLWLPFFADELLWSAVSHWECSLKLPVGVSSWSWASCPGTVRTHTPLADSTYCTENVVYQCAIGTFPPPTPFTQLSNLTPTRLRLSGWLTPAAVAPHNLFKGYWHLVPPRLPSILNEDTGYHSACPPLSWPWHDPRPTIPAISRIIYYPDSNRDDITGQEVLCLVVQRVVADFGLEAAERYDTIDRGLTLRAVGSGERLYRRVGYFRAGVPGKQQGEMAWGEVEIV